MEVIRFLVMTVFLCHPVVGRQVADFLTIFAIFGRIIPLCKELRTTASAEKHYSARQNTAGLLHAHCRMHKIG